MLKLSPHLVWPALAFVIGVVLTPLVARAAKRFGWMAVPRKDRWHKQATATLGGIAIYCAVGFPLLWLADFGSIVRFIHVHSPDAAPPDAMAVAWLAMTSLFLLGLLDDFLHLRPQNKLIVEIMAASLVAFLGYRLQWVTSLTGDTMLTIVWIVGIINATNLLDNMDGLCGGICLIAAVFFSLLHYQTASFDMVTMALLVAGALAAFLIYNFHPASIFMGDCGSLPLGLGLAFLCLYPAKSVPDLRVSLYAVPALVLMVPIFDTTMVTLIRLLSGRKASRGGQDHTSHRLVLMGLSETGAVFFLYGTAVLSGLSALFVQEHDSLAAPTVIIPLLLSLTLMGIYLAQIRVYPEKEFCRLREGRFTPILIEITYKRQMFRVVLDLVLVGFAYYLSYRVRFGFTDQFNAFFPIFLKSLPAIIICKFVAFFSAGIYRGMWRYIGLSDAFVYLKATVLGSLLSLAVVIYTYRFLSFSKGVFLVDWLLTTTFLLGSRISFRSFRELMNRKTIKGENVLIYGAGQGGQVLLREILDNGRLGVKPVGFIDDDRMKVGRQLQGYPVMGTGADLEQILEEILVNGLIISCRDLSDENRKRLAELCHRKGISLKRFVLNLEDVECNEPLS
jgi:UDP-GlcNAc:undecaprenyl-phosphate GlcNAc-1-phosphate transferase